jgi:glycerate-2-kinase
MMDDAWWQAGPFAGPASEAALRADAGAILHAALAAVDPEAAVAKALEARDGSVPDGIRILAIGKAAGGMARAAVRALGDRVRDGRVVMPPGLSDRPPASLRYVEGDHPVPGAASVAAGAAVAAFAASCSTGDTVLCLLSGGTSSLAVQPIHGLTVTDLAEAGALLMHAGAPVHEVNAVRRRFDGLKGGRLALAFAPARILALMVSDVPGDDPATIGSGPVTPDATTWRTTRGVLERYGLLDRVPAAMRTAIDAGIVGNLEDAPRPDDARLPRVDSAVIASVRLAVAAARAEGIARGYAIAKSDDVISGEARRVGRDLVARLTAASGRRALIQGGETTVTVTGKGSGGRNQEVVLGAVRGLAGIPGSLVAALGTDGIDGPTDAAGAVACAGTLARAAEQGLDPDAALADNDAYPFFDALGDLIRTGPTGTNVMDVYVALGSRVYGDGDGEEPRR